MEDLQQARTAFPESIHTLLEDYLIFSLSLNSSSTIFPSTDLSISPKSQKQTEEFLQSSHTCVQPPVPVALTLCLLRFLSQPDRILLLG